MARFEHQFVGFGNKKRKARIEIDRGNVVGKESGGQYIGVVVVVLAAGAASSFVSSYQLLFDKDDILQVSGTERVDDGVTVFALFFERLH